MRPPEFTGGNRHLRQTAWSTTSLRFNEAAGIHRRKRPIKRTTATVAAGFNEAAGIHRRKRAAIAGIVLACALLQ